MLLNLQYGYDNITDTIKILYSLHKFSPKLH